MTRDITPEEAKKYFSRATTKDLSGHQYKVHSVDWNTAGNKLASGSLDKTVKVWNFDPSRGSYKDLTLSGHTESVEQLRWSPVLEQQLASTSGDKTVRIWFQNPENRQKLSTQHLGICS